MLNEKQRTILIKAGLSAYDLCAPVISRVYEQADELGVEITENDFHTIFTAIHKEIGA